MKHVPTHVYHACRLAAATADCGTCVEAEINLARAAGLDADSIDLILAKNPSGLEDALSAPVRLSFAVNNRTDDAESRNKIMEMYGKNGLIELAFAMNGAALLPGIKRAMGHATSCNL